MRRFILTGTPGSGKTAILRQLELEGFPVVEEAATDIIAREQARGIAEPWRDVDFIDRIVDLQVQRQKKEVGRPNRIQFHDRSVFCTAALAKYLNYPVSKKLSRELERAKREQVFQHRVLFVRNLGFIQPSPARRISFEEALRFERIHEETYREHGFTIVSIGRASVEERVAAIAKLVS